MRKVLIASLLSAIVAALPVSGQGVSLTIPISLPGGLLLPGITGTLKVTFESADGATAGNLNASSQLVSPLDLSLLTRLPLGISIPALFPVLVRIEPPPAGGLSFDGVNTVEILTAGLPLSLIPLRIYSAPVGGTFHDITTSVQSVAQPGQANSTYRAQGSSGGFSEFIVILDPTPVTTVIGSKLDRLDQILADNAGAMPGAVHADLAAQLATVRSHSAPGNEAAALADLDTFSDSVKTHSGTDIPDLWRSARDLIDVAGQLRAAAATLQLSLRQRQGS